MFSVRCELVDEALICFVWEAEGIWKSLHDTHQLLFSSKFLILSACVQQTLKNLCFDLRTKSTSVRLSTLSYIICLHGLFLGLALA